MMDCSCPEGEPRCGACPKNPKCRYFKPTKDMKWYRCGNKEVWGTCSIPQKQCPSCEFFKPPGLPGRPRKDEFYDPGLDDKRAFDPFVSAEELRADTQQRYFEAKKDDPEFKAKRAEYMRKYRRGLKNGAPQSEPPG